MLAWTATRLGRFAYFIAIAVYAFDAGGRAENLIASRAGALRASELEAV